jgi:hypothetical protein
MPYTPLTASTSARTPKADMIPAMYWIPIVPRAIAWRMLMTSSAGWSGSTSLSTRPTAGMSASGSPVVRTAKASRIRGSWRMGRYIVG